MTRALLQALDARADAGRPVAFWLRDDDAVAPGPALHRLITLTGERRVACTLAVIPKFAEDALALQVQGTAHVTVVQHGWAHANHAPAQEKKMEFGPHRPLSAMTDDLHCGKDRLSGLFGPQFLPVFVPPWNRIAPAVVQALPDVGFQGLSVFGPEHTCALPVLNAHVDVIDWRGTRGGRDDAVLHAEIVQVMARGGPVGVLTHHLVHDAQCWGFLQRLFALTADHPGCRWCGLPALLGSP